LVWRLFLTRGYRIAEPETFFNLRGGVLPTPFAYFKMLLETIEQLLGRPGGLADDATHSLPPQFHAACQRKALPISAPSPLHHLQNFARAIDDNAFAHTTTQSLHLAGLAQHAQGWHDKMQATDTLGQDDDARRMGYLISLSLAFFRGAMDNGVFRAGFDTIDDWEISEWLLHYGASRDAVYSAVFRGCYDYVFGYPGGITDDRKVGAGTAIRGLLRLAFTYKGALFYKMQAGMGDTIFGPYYQVLQSRGVKFRFFNAATNLVLDQGGNTIAAIDMVEQAGLRRGE